MTNLHKIVIAPWIGIGLLLSVSAALAASAIDGTPQAVSATATNTASLNLPTTTGPSDTYVICAVNVTNNRTWTPSPANFSQPTNCAQAPTVPQAICWTSTTAASGASETITVSGAATTIHAAAFAVSGTSGVIDQCAASANTSSTTMTAPSLGSLTQSNDYLIMAYEIGAVPGVTCSAPSTGSLFYGATTFDSQCAASVQLASSGATGSQTVTISAANVGTSFQIAMEQASSGPIGSVVGGKALIKGSALIH